MFARDITPSLLKMAQQYPIVTVLGPRQAGKTTLLRATFSDKSYANLEDPDVRKFAAEDPKAFLAQYPKGAILDEIQRVPVLLSYIQVLVDELRQNGLFLLSGSHQTSLHEAIAQSLAGRTALLNLYPLSMKELKAAQINLDINTQLLHGFYPRIYQDHLEPTQAYRDYYRTYVERDVRSLINLKDVSLFEKFMRLCAGRIGSVLELSSLANEVGVSSPTIQHWLSLLEASYLIIRLQPYYGNINKRLIKSPKLYFTDVGLACFLLNISEACELEHDRMRGFLFENLIIMDIIKNRYNANKTPNWYFYRDSHHNEVDLLLEKGRNYTAIEIKSAQTVAQDFTKGLRHLKTASTEQFLSGYIFYAGDLSYTLNDMQVRPFMAGIEELS